MRKVFVVLLLALAVFPSTAATARPSGIEGVVLNTTCYGPCAYPAPAAQPYTGEVTVQVRRARDGALVASRTPTDGRFRIRMRRGLYDVSAITTPAACPQTSCPCGPYPASSKVICPAAAPTVQPCLTGDTQRVGVRRHRFSHVELHVQNACIV